MCGYKKKMSFAIFVILFLSCNCGVFGENVERQVVQALETNLRFLKDNYKDINIDGLFGVVFAQAHLEAISECNGNRASEILENLSRKIIKDLTKHLNSTGDFKQRLFLKTLMDPKIWKKSITFEKGNLNMTNLLLKKHEDNINPSFFDKCLTELMSSRQNGAECTISKLCRDFMVDNSLHTTDYIATHRLLYLQILKALKCNLIQRTKLLIRQYCSYIYWELFQNFKTGFLPTLNDLSLEQITLCGFEGFEEFVDLKFMNHVLDIQNASGCFGRTKRIKRTSNVIRHGCTDHATGLGASALALFFRYLRCPTQ